MAFARKSYIYLASTVEIDKAVILRCEVTGLDASEQDFDSVAEAKAAIESGDCEHLLYVPVRQIREVMQ